MARKLSRIATNGLILIAFLAVTACAPSAGAQPGVQVAPATDVVVNPFAPKSRDANLRSAQPIAVPRESANEPKAFQNPFAARSAAPRVLTPMPTAGSLSRWRRPVELPGEGRTNRPAPPTESRWDVLTPDAFADQQMPEEPRPLELPQPPAARELKVAGPPDPVRFAPSSLHQPYWLLPDPTTGEDTATEPAPVAETVRLPQPEIMPPAAYPTTEGTIVETAGGVVMVTDATTAMQGSKDAAGCYTSAEQTASTATTVEEFGSVVRICQDGLACHPPTQLAGSLRSLAAWASNRRGEIKSDDRREDEALQEFEVAIQFDPNCWLALHNRGVSRAQQGDSDGALQDFNRAITLNPGLAVAYRNRGELLAAMGRTEEAVADYGRALDQMPNDADVLLMRGHALHRLGKYDASLADLNRAISIAPRNAEAYAHRGNVYAETGEFARAIRDFQMSLKLDSASPDAYRSLAWLMATCPDPRFRDPDQALVAAQRAAKLAPPGDCFVLDALAAAHANAGQFDQAVRYQREAVSIAPVDFQSSFSGRLALYQHQRPFRNAGRRAVDNGVRAASLEANARQQ